MKKVFQPAKIGFASKNQHGQITKVYQQKHKPILGRKQYFPKRGQIRDWGSDEINRNQYEKDASQATMIFEGGTDDDYGSEISEMQYSARSAPNQLTKITEEKSLKDVSMAPSSEAAIHDIDKKTLADNSNLSNYQSDFVEDPKWTVHNIEEDLKHKIQQEKYDELREFHKKREKKKAEPAIFKSRNTFAIQKYKTEEIEIEQNEQFVKHLRSDPDYEKEAQYFDWVHSQQKEALQNVNLMKTIQQQKTNLILLQRDIERENMATEREKINAPPIAAGMVPTAPKDLNTQLYKSGRDLPANKIIGKNNNIININKVLTTDMRETYQYMKLVEKDAEQRFEAEKQRAERDAARKKFELENGLRDEKKEVEKLEIKRRYLKMKHQKKFKHIPFEECEFEIKVVNKGLKRLYHRQKLLGQEIYIPNPVKQIDMSEDGIGVKRKNPKGLRFHEQLKQEEKIKNDPNYRGQFLKKKNNIDPALMDNQSKQSYAHQKHIFKSEEGDGDFETKDLQHWYDQRYSQAAYKIKQFYRLRHGSSGLGSKVSTAAYNAGVKLENFVKIQKKKLLFQKEKLDYYKLKQEVIEDYNFMHGVAGKELVVPEVD